jgi:hypothetical protein
MILSLAYLPAAAGLLYVLVVAGVVTVALVTRDYDRRRIALKILRTLVPHRSRSR